MKAIITIISAFSVAASYLVAAPASAAYLTCNGHNDSSNSDVVYAGQVEYWDGYTWQPTDNIGCCIAYNGSETLTSDDKDDVDYVLSILSAGDDWFVTTYTHQCSGTSYRIVPWPSSWALYVYASGGAGADAIIGSPNPTVSDLIYGGDGNDYIWGGPGNDTIDGDSNDDVIYGGDGADYLDGGTGNDEIYGGDGNDNIEGEAGSDNLYGGGDNDDIYGGDDDCDYIDGGTGGGDYCLCDDYLEMITWIGMITTIHATVRAQSFSMDVMVVTIHPVLTTTFRIASVRTAPFSA